MTSRVRVDVRQLLLAADQVEEVRGGALVREATAVVNDVTRAFEIKVIDDEIAGINLSRTYVKDKTSLTLARVSANPVASLETAGDLTPLGRFLPISQRPGNGALRRAGPRIGRRNAGVDVAIKRTGSTFEPQWFLLPLKNNPGLYGVFVRDDRLPPSRRAAREGSAGKRHIYGPSPYQLFRHQLDVQTPQLQETLGREALRRLGDVVATGLEP
jgi:hypothetical protein